MSNREVMVWSAYRSKYGTFNYVRRYDRPAAVIADVLAKVNGNKNSTMKDYMPFGHEQAAVSDLDAVISAAGGRYVKRR